MPHYPSEIEYSERYEDAVYEYRHVFLPKAVAKEAVRISGAKDLLEEGEWRGLGVQQKRGWRHYMWHRPEPHILLFRRFQGTEPTTGAERSLVFTLRFGSAQGFVQCCQLSGKIWEVQAPDDSDCPHIAENLRETAATRPGCELLGRVVFISDDSTPAVLWQESF